jgi:hypothetical protein
VAALSVAEVPKNRKPGAVHVDLQGDHRSGTRDRGIGPAEVPGDLRGQLAVPPVMGAVGTVAHLPQQMAAPLRAIAGPARQSLRMKTDPDHIDRRLQQLRRAAGQQPVNGEGAGLTAARGRAPGCPEH